MAGGEPGERHPDLEGPADHRLGELRLGGELGLGGDARLAAAVRVVGPGPREIQFPVDQRVPVHRGVGQEHPDLAVLGPPGGPGVLPLHPGPPGALLEEPGLIGDQHPVRVAEVIDGIAPLQY